MPRSSFLILFLAVWPAFLVAQQPTANLRGTVSDEKGELLPGITLILEGTTQGAVTDASGSFEIKNIKTGSYNLLVSSIGYTRHSRAITLKAGQILQIDIQLEEDAHELAEVVVRAETEAILLERTAEAVSAIDTRKVKLLTADLGEVMARNQGVSVQRSGGLGSGTRFSLNGLTDDKIRFFLDGIPLEFTPYAFGIANVPVNLVNLVEIYKGVVPIRFGADALGGAVNLVSPEVYPGFSGAVSYQVGSFGTHRFTLGASNYNKASGLFFQFSAFYDRALNDYEIDVMVPDRRPENRGRLIPSEIERFHDAYEAGGVSAEMGVLDKSWADKISLNVFYSDFDKELQNNRSMSRPFGGVEFGERTLGATVDYQKNFLAEKLSVNLKTGYTYSSNVLLDTSTCIVNWYGECDNVRPRGGEISPGNPKDETLFEEAGFTRLDAGWVLNESNSINLSISPTVVKRDGEDRILEDGEVSTITADRTLITTVTGIEHQLTLFDGKVENIVFGKGYFQSINSKDPVTGGTNRVSVRSISRSGWGNAIRYLFSQNLYAKISYEYATRLPRADEIFGDVVDVNANLELEPEVSHNVNLGLTLTAPNTKTGYWRGEVNGFLRDTENLILVLPAFGNRFRYENAFSARSVGIETSFKWNSTNDMFGLSGNFTYIDFRNLTESGPLASFEGDRIPNLPYLFSNAAVELRTPSYKFMEGDKLSLNLSSRFVYQFFEFWESAGTRDSKRLVPTQNVQNLGLTYRLALREQVFSFTGEVANLFDEKVFDFFGAQRPGRAFFIKAVIEF
ncbi:MAG: carboxypeptidase-like regulatory domain-containing protein [Cyclobacteriaceae bacterium]